MRKERIVQDFASLQKDITAILLFNLEDIAKNREQNKSYIILVAPNTSSKRLKREIRNTINLREKPYSVGIFHDLNLKLQHHIIEKHEVAWKQPEFRLSKFFDKHLRSWREHREDVEHLKHYLLTRLGFSGFLIVIAFFYPRLTSLCIPISFIVGLLVLKKVFKLASIGLPFSSKEKSLQQLMDENMLKSQEYKYMP